MVNSIGCFDVWGPFYWHGLIDVKQWTTIIWSNAGIVKFGLENENKIIFKRIQTDKRILRIKNQCCPISRISFHDDIKYAP